MLLDEKNFTSAILGETTAGVSVSKDDCSFYGRMNTTGFGFIRSYEGIPENLLVNLVVSAVGAIRAPPRVSQRSDRLDSSAGFRLSPTSVF